MLLQEEYEDIVHVLGDKGASHGFRDWKRVSAANVASERGCRDIARELRSSQAHQRQTGNSPCRT